MAEKGADAADSVPYAETSALTRLLGVGSRVKIIDVFLGKHYTELTVKEVSDLAGLDESTVHRNIRDIIDSGIIEKAGSEGQAQLYRLNKNSRIAQILGRARDELGRQSDKIPRSSDRSAFLSMSRGPDDIQESIRNYTFEGRDHDTDEGPRPSEYIDVGGSDDGGSLNAVRSADV